VRVLRAAARACTGSPTRPTANVYLYSDLETFDAHRVYACFDQPDMKAVYELMVQAAPRTWTRGCPTWRPTAESGVDAGGGERSLALPADAVDGDLHHARVRGPRGTSSGPSHDGIPLGHPSAASRSPRYLDPDEIFEVTRQGL